MKIIILALWLFVASFGFTWEELVDGFVQYLIEQGVTVVDDNGEPIERTGIIYPGDKERQELDQLIEDKGENANE